MWPTLLLLALGGSTIKESYIWSPDAGWNPHEKYVYTIHTRSLVSHNALSNQNVGVISQADAEIALDKKNPQQLNVHIKNARFAHVLTKLNNGWTTHLPEDTEAKWQELKLNQPIFAILFNHSVVSSIIISRETSSSEANYYRSIASQLVFNLNGSHLVEHPYNQAPSGIKPYAVYSVMEESLLGNCQTLYDCSIIPLYQLQYNEYLAPAANLSNSATFIEVLKVTDFSNCDRHVMYFHGATPSNHKRKNVNRQRNIVQRSSITRAVIQGSPSNYTLHSSVTTNEIQVFPHIRGSDVSKVNSEVNLTLKKIVSGSYINSPPNQIHLSLHFQLPIEIFQNKKFSSAKKFSDFSFSHSRSHIPLHQLLLKGTFQSAGENGQDINPLCLPVNRMFFSSSDQLDRLIINIKELVRDVGDEMVRNITTANRNTLSKFSYLTQLIQHLSLEQLKELTDYFFVSLDVKSYSSAHFAWVTFCDAVAEAGSMSSLEVITFWIQRKYVSPENGSRLIQRLSRTVFSPSSEYIKLFFEEIILSAPQQNPSLEIAAVLSFTNLLRRSFSEEGCHGDQSRNQARETITNIYIPWLAARLHNAYKKGNSKNILLYIRALGNVADPSILKVFQSLLKGVSPAPNGRSTIFQRMSIMMALNKMAEANPEEAQAVAYNVYQNSAEAYEVRVAAILVIMNTNPPGDMLQRMARATHFDPSPQVVSATCSAIKNAAKIVDPDMQELVTNAKTAVRLLTTMSVSAHYSQNAVRDSFLKNRGHLDYLVQWNVIGSNDHIIPKAAYFRMGPLSNAYLSTFEYSAMVSSINQMINLWNGWDNSDYLQPTAPKFDQDGTVNMGPRTNEPFDAELFFEIVGGEMFTTVNKQDLSKIPANLIHYIQQLNEGKNVNYITSYLGSRMTYIMPDITGNLIHYSFKSPTSVYITAAVNGPSKLHLNDDDTLNHGDNFPNIFKILKKLQRLEININVSTKFATMKQEHIGLINLFNDNGMLYMAVHDQQLTINVAALTNTTYFKSPEQTRGIDITLEPLNISDTNMFRLTSEPYTTHHELMSPCPPSLTHNRKPVNNSGLRQLSMHVGPNEAIDYELITKNELMPPFNSVLGNDIFSRIPFFNAKKEQLYSDVFLRINNRHLKNIKFSMMWGGLLDLNQPSPKKTENDHKHHGTFSELLHFGLFVCTSKGFDVYEASINYTESQIKKNDFFQLTFRHSESGLNCVNSCKHVNLAVAQELNISVHSIWVSAPLFYVQEVEKYSYNSTVNVIVGWSDYLKNETMNIYIKGNLDRTPQRLEYLLNDPVVKQCAREIEENNQFLQFACRNSSELYSILDYYYFNASFDELAPSSVNIISKLYSILGRTFWTYTPPKVTSNSTESELLVKYDPTMRALSIRVTVPDRTVAWNNIHLNHFESEILPIHPTRGLLNRFASTMLRGEDNPLCVLDTSLINTFDNRTFDLQSSFGKCWQVMMTRNTNSIQPENNITILVSDDDPHSRIIRVIAGRGLEIIMVAPGKIHEKDLFHERVAENTIGLKLPGKYNSQTIHGADTTQYIIKTEYNIINIFYSREHLSTLHLEEQNVRIMFDGKRIIVIAPNLFRSNIHGLCGSFTGDRSIASSYYKSLAFHDPEDFVASHLYSTTDCQDDDTVKRISSRKVSHFNKDILLIDPIPPNIISEYFTRNINGCRSVFKCSSESHCKPCLTTCSHSRPRNNAISSFSSSPRTSIASSHTCSCHDPVPVFSTGNLTNNLYSCELKYHFASFPDPDSTTTDPDSTTTDPDSTTTDPDSTTTDPDSTTTDPDSTTTDPDSTTTDPDSKANSSTSKPKKSLETNKEIRKVDNKMNNIACTRSKVRLVIHDSTNMYCYSKRELLNCDDKCLPLGVHPELVDFHCIRKSAVAKFWARKIKDGAPVDLSRKRTTKVMQLMVPEECRMNGEV